MAVPSGRSICPFLIMCIVSMPAMMIRALQNDLNPSIGPVILLTARWSCSTMLLRYLFWRIRMSTQASALMLSMAVVLAPLLSIVIFSGKSCRLMASSRNRRADALSRLAVRRKNRIACAINGAVKVLPVTCHFDVGLVHSPARSHGSFALAKDCCKHRQHFDCPAMHGGVINENTALVHQFLNMSQAQWVGHVPAYACEHHFQWIVKP